MKRAVACVLLLCSCIPQIDREREPPPLRFSVTLRVVDQAGEPVAGAAVELPGGDATTDERGVASLEELEGPLVAVVRAQGFLAEPVPVGVGDAQQELRVRLLGDGGGRRLVMHFGGDAMFGRRYEQPEGSTPLIPTDDAAAGARNVVAHLAPAFAAAHFRALNLESVVSERGQREAYPGKRFLLRSHPDALAALHALQIDMVGFANNHTRDWLDRGVADSLWHLEASGIPQAGGGLDQAQAEQPLIQDIAGYRIATLAYTSVTGSFVNDNYPTEATPVPEQLPAKDAWLYERRAFDLAGTALSLPDQPLRIGTLWRAFAERESSMTQAEQGAAWAALVATFPELQDWVARRGHGGAAMWRSALATERIAELAPAVDLLVVQMHSGFQFQDVASENLRAAARAAIDAGADVVIAHHPHVLQGMEWYKGRLIAHSLGNFIFDQDFLSTFASGFLRLVWEGRTLLEARFVPTELIGYRPTPVTDQAALRTLRTLWERSVRPAHSARDPITGGVYPFEMAADPEAKPVHLRFEHHTARLVHEPATVSVQLELPPGEVVGLDPTLLVPGRLGLPADSDAEVYVARDLFGWGHFEDVAADGSQALTAHWAMGHRDKQITRGDARSGHGLMRLRRAADNQSVLTFRPVARIPLPRHYLVAAGPEGPLPLEPKASYGLRFSARARGHVQAGVRIDLYHFDDTDPTEDPSSERLARQEIAIEGLSGRFRQFEIEIDPRALSGDQRANMVMFYFTLTPPDGEGEALLEVDDVAFLEWRRASAMPEGVFGAYTHAKSVGAGAELRFEALSAVAE